MRRALLVIVTLVVVVASVCCSLQAAIGIGVELFGGVPFLTVNSNWGSIGGEVGMGLSSCSLGGEMAMDLSLVWYCVNAKYYLTLATESGLHPYLGGGVIGLNVNGSVSYLGTEVTASGSATGGLVLGGLEYAFASMGLPLVIGVGANYIVITGVKVTASDGSVSLTEELPLDMSTLGLHIGVRYIF